MDVETFRCKTGLRMKLSYLLLPLCLMFACTAMQKPAPFKDQHGNIQRCCKCMEPAYHKIYSDGLVYPCCQMHADNFFSSSKLAESFGRWLAGEK